MQSNKPIESIRIFEISGKLMTIKNSTSTGGQSSLTVAVGLINLPAGMYLAQIKDAPAKV